MCSLRQLDRCNNNYEMTNKRLLPRRRETTVRCAMKTIKCNLTPKFNCNAVSSAAVC